ncbi:MAG: hypothetical protein FWE23_01045 [Chitinivibrionia bacterium]|jgi:type II secretory pathway pseudopilin PulG|nr:hypothetical protein [Chitinivibrionia bacterium]
MLDVLRKNNGYSLIEVVVAMVGLSLTVLLLGTILTMSVRTTSGTRDMDMTLAAARAKMNEIVASTELLMDLENVVQGGDVQTDVYTAPNGRRIDREWSFEAGEGTTLFVRVTAVAQDGMTPPVTITSIIDINNICNPQSSVQNAPIIRVDENDTRGGTASLVIITRHLDFAANDNSISTENITLFSVSPHLNDAEAARGLEITGPNRGLVRSVRNQSIAIDTNTLQNIDSNTNLRFDLRYLSCAGAAGRQIGVEFRFRRLLPAGNDTPGNNCPPTFEGELFEEIGGVLSRQEQSVGTINCTGNFTLNPPANWTIGTTFPFRLDGNRVIARSGYNFNYERTSKYTFTITVDGAEHPIAATVRIIDVNEPPTALLFHPLSSTVQTTSFTVPRNASVGDNIANLFAVDEDTSAYFLRYEFDVLGQGFSFFEVSNVYRNRATLRVRAPLTSAPAAFSFDIRARNIGNPIISPPIPAPAGIAHVDATITINIP